MYTAITAPTSSDIIRAKEATSFEVASVCNDLFGSTWHQSYVRLIEVTTTMRVSNAVNLAYLVARTRSAFDIDEAMSDSCLTSASIEELRLLHSTALAELAKPDHDLNQCLIATLNAIDLSRASNVKRVIFKIRENSSINQASSKPRQEMLFNIADKFIYLALHNES